MTELIRIKRYQAKLKEQGLCVYCRKPRYERSKAVCFECLLKYRNKYKAKGSKRGRPRLEEIDAIVKDRT